YRYWVVSSNAAGITLTPIANGWALTDTTTGTTTANPTTAAAAFSTVATTHAATPYIDVGLATTANQTVHASTRGPGDATSPQTDPPPPRTPQLTGTPGHPTPAPPQLPGTSVSRYYLTGTSPLFPLGKIDVAFPAGAWHDTAAASAASSGS